MSDTIGININVETDSSDTKRTNKKKRKRFPGSPNVIVRVTHEIIQTAIRRNSNHCMIADAVKLAVPNAKRVSVDLQTIRWTDEERELRYTYLTPRIGQVGLIDFDQGKMPDPFEMKLQGAHVTRAKSFVRRTKESQWKPIKDALTTLRNNKTISIKNVAEKVGLTPHGLRQYLLPSVSTSPRIEVIQSLHEFVKLQPDGKKLLVDPEPVTNKRSKASSLPEQAILRPTAAGNSAERIGGLEAPRRLYRLRREFGLKSMVR